MPASIWLPGANGIRVHGLAWGAVSAPRLILLLHGVGGNAHVWKPVAQRLDASIGHRYRIVALDGRDGGSTDHPATGYAPEDFGADLASVHESLGGGPLTLVGHSRGGWTASWFAARHADRVERLVLVDPARLTFATGADADRFYEWVREGIGPFPTREAALAWARDHDPEAEWNEARKRAFLAGFVEQQDGTLVGRLPASAVEQLRTARESGDSVGPYLDRITCPVLLLVGTRQSAARRRDKLAYAAGPPDVCVVAVNGTHFLHTDAPGEVADHIGRFLVEPASPA